MTSYTITVSSTPSAELVGEDCTGVFTYKDGSHSSPGFTGTITGVDADGKTVSMSSAIMNIEASWTAFGGATGGTLTISSKRTQLAITNFVNNG